MQNRTENPEIIKGSSVVNGVSNEEIDELIKKFENLKKRVAHNQAAIDDVELLVREIINLTASIDNKDSISIKNIGELSKNYTILLPFLMQVYQAVCENQKKYPDLENLGEEQIKNSNVFVEYLKLALIQPMLLNTADITQIFFNSKYFGKIPIISMCESDIHKTIDLYDIDVTLEKNMNLLHDRSLFSALLPYALTFSFINKEREQITTSLTNKTLFNYLIESANSDQQIIDSNPPRLIFTSNDVIRIFLPNTDLNSHMFGTTLRDEKIILISIDTKNNFDNIVKNIIHEIQDLYNAYFLTSDKQADYSKDLTSSDLSNTAINTFIQFIDLLKFDNPLFYDIVKDIKTILGDFAEHEQYRNLDKLSAHLTLLLFKYPFGYLRDFFDIAIIQIDEILNKNGNSGIDSMVVCLCISSALSHIDNTIMHLCIALLEFNITKIYEFLNNHFTNETTYNELREHVPKFSNKPLGSYSCDELLKLVLTMEAANKTIVQKISNYNRAYSLFNLIKSGNDEWVRNLLQISKRDINIEDGLGYSPLAYAVKQPSTFKLLLQFGASLKWEGSSDIKVKKYTLLHLAAYFGSFELIPMLLKNGLSATCLNAQKQNPLILLTKFIASQNHQDTLKEKIEENNIYHASIEALTYLLSYSADHIVKPNKDPGSIFYIALTKFRKDIALFYLLYTNGIFRVKMPNDIIRNIVLQFNEKLPNETYKHCYRDIMSLLLSNRSLLNKFVTLGLQTAYNELQEFILNSLNPINAIKNFFVELIPLDTPLSSYNKASLSQEEGMQLLSNYYSKRNIHLAATSLSAVTSAQKQLRAKSVRPFFESDRYNERRLVINKWKKKADNNEDEGLSRALEKICEELNISEIDNATYHKLSMVLNKLVIYGNKTPTNYTPQLFVQEFKNKYQEEYKESQHNRVKLKIT